MIIFVSDAYAEQYQGGGELTTEAIIDASLFPVNKVLSRQVTIDLMREHQHCYWIFGNFAGVNPKCLLYAAKNLKYSVIEYDYKYCKYRSAKKHEMIEGACKCSESHSGKLVSAFLAKSDTVFWMSHGQYENYREFFPFLSKNSLVLSSIFSPDTLEYISSLDTNNKNNKWIILNSPSWIKGTEDTISYAKENNLDYELVWNLEYKDLLAKLANSKGLLFLPKAEDTCPRLVIEAKLLGCELILNEYVQHKDEKWFSEKDIILKYLKNRADIFWDRIENFAYKKLNFSLSDYTNKNKFKIVVPFYNVENWISKCIKSLQIQKYKNFKCYLIDDISTDKSVEKIQILIQGDDRFELTQNKIKQYALGNIANSIVQAGCDDEDIIILLDGDDWLASTRTLNILSETYDKNNCLMTYGSYVYNPSGRRGVEPSAYSDEVIESNGFRKDSWRASHLRSFKYKLWKHLDQEDLKDEHGDYYKMAYDQAIMLPLLEMSSKRSYFIEDILYVYNKENPLNVDKIKAQQQYNIAQEVRDKKSYTAI